MSAPPMAEPASASLSLEDHPKTTGHGKPVVPPPQKLSQEQLLFLNPKYLGGGCIFLNLSIYKTFLF